MQMFLQSCCMFAHIFIQHSNIQDLSSFPFFYNSFTYHTIYLLKMYNSVVCLDSQACAVITIVSFRTFHQLNKESYTLQLSSLYPQALSNH